VAFTSAPATTAPAASFTTPVICPAGVCAMAAKQHNKKLKAVLFMSELP
jgi:hypothetical protein